MTFVEPVFAIFFVLTYVGFLLLRRRRSLQLLFLNAASCFFYGWAGPKFLMLLLATSTFDFFLAKRIHAASTQGAKKGWLLASLGTNLCVLAFFKYSNFFLTNTNEILGWMGLSPLGQMAAISLPIGISFYTFEAMSYTIDVYRGVHPPVTSFREFLFFMCEFPKLVAGPIVRAGEFLPQLRSDLVAKIDPAGLLLLLRGLFKKLVLGDMIGFYFVDPFFSHPQNHGSLTLLLSLFCYSAQIYFDFSGYSDMALGLGRLMGLKLPENFDRPYLATTPSEFWRRWHMTLSRWIRDYLFLPLGGSQGSRGRTFRNILIVMFLSGLWHGAGWTFVLWGLLHGAYLILYAFVDKENSYWQKAPFVLRRATFFLLLSFAWTLFRAEDLSHTVAYWTELLRFSLGDPREVIGMVCTMTIVWLFHDYLEPSFSRWEIASVRWPAWAIGSLLFAALVMVTRLNLADATHHAFIYFQF